MNAVMLSKGRMGSLPMSSTSFRYRSWSRFGVSLWLWSAHKSMSKSGNRGL